MKKIVLLFLISLSFYLPNTTFSQGLEWVTKEGPYNIRNVNDVSVGIISGGSVEYLATTYNGLLKSTNNGGTWTPLLSYQNMNVVACVRDKSDFVYASQCRESCNLYKSTNGGSTFTTINNGISNLNIIKISISPFDSDRILIGCYSCLTTCPTLYLTTDGGDNWQSVDFNGGGYDDLSVVDIAWSINNSDVVFLCSFGSSIYPCGNNSGIFRSDNGGLNWTQKNSGLGYCNVYSLGVESDPSGEGEYIYAGKWAAQDYSPGIYRSTNYGDNWTVTSFSQNIPVYDIEIINSTIYAGLGYNCDPDYHGLLKSTNHGENWTALHNGLEVNASMRLGLVDDDNIWLGGPASFYNSTNGGSSFTEKVSTLKKENIPGLTTNQSGIFCTGDLDAPRISFTTNGGSTWINTVYNCINIYNNNLIGGKIVTDFDNDNIMHSTHYHSSQILIYKTTDGGSNWYPVYDDLDADPPIAAPFSLKDIAIDPNNHDILFVCGGGNYHLKVWKSEDRGESYSIVFNDVNSANTLNSIAIDYHVESHNISLEIYAGGPEYDNDVNMYKSTNSGANWEQYNSGLDGDVNSIAVTPYISPFVNSYYIFAGTSEGVYRKSNTNNTWSETVSGMNYQNVTTVVTDPTSANIIYAGSNDNSNYGHIYFSTDYGDSWTEQNDGFPSASINQLKLCTDPSSGELSLFAATSEGVFQAVESSKDNVNLQKKLNVTSYPNPFNSSTIVRFNVIYDANVEMDVYDILGRKVTTLAKGYFKKGVHSISFKANNLASDIYFLISRFNNSNILYNKIVLIK
jgi:photosystem II stability/assembly factor-like uncharacterized protein